MHYKELLAMYGCPEPLFPMNAKNGAEKKQDLLDSEAYTAEVKFDGSRYFSIDGNFYSRHPSEDKSSPETLGLPVDKTLHLPHLSAFFEMFPGNWLDGEVIRVLKDGTITRSDDVVEILGCTPEKAISRQQETGYLCYVVFDVLFHEYKPVHHLPLRERLSLLGTLAAEWEPDIVLHEREFGRTIQRSKVYHGHQAKKDLLAYTEEHNLEGIMLKNLSTAYSFGKRPEHYWYKLKKVTTSDVVIMDFTEGKGKFAGLVGSIIFGQYKGDDLVECGSCSGMDDAFRKELTDNKSKYIGQVIEISAMERTKKGMFRHPQFKQVRLDKSAQMCQWDDE